MTDSKDLTTEFFNPTAKNDGAAEALTPGMILNNKYELIEQIGRGGMGVVWKAKDIVADRLVALKFVPTDLKRFETEMNRVRESFRKVHALNHQWICPTYGLEDGGHLGYYLVMKYLEGETLDQYVARKDPKREGLPLDQVIAILSRVAIALDYAHLNKVIHRDIKPANIFLIKVAGKMHIQLIDFGLVDEIRSTLSRVSQIQFDISGTRPYMSPEQWRGRTQSAATDQYALGVVAYELLAGRLPFMSSDFKIMENAVLNMMPESIPMISEHANAALQQALAKNPADRFGNCQEFITALHVVWTSVAEEDEVSPPSSVWAVPALRFTMPYWNWESFYNRNVLLSLLLLVLIAAVTLTGVKWHSSSSPPSEQIAGEETIPQPQNAAQNNSNAEQVKQLIEETMFLLNTDSMQSNSH